MLGSYVEQALKKWRRKF